MQLPLRDRLKAIHAPLAIYLLVLVGLGALAMRGGIEAGGAAEAEADATVEITRGIHYQGEDGPTLHVYRPENVTGLAPAVIAVHGGTWRHGDGGKMADVAEQIAAHGFVVFKLGYRYADKKNKIGAWPGQLNDIKDGVRWVRENAGDYNVDPRRIAALGSSSGAHMVALLATMNKGPLTEDSRVLAAVTWSAFLDLPDLRGHKYFPGIRILLDCEDGSACTNKLNRASPTNHVSPDDSPMLLVNATDELVPTDQPEEMQQKLESNGVDAELKLIEGSDHGQTNSEEALPRTLEYLRERIGPTATFAE